jgi:hypothetical protein
MSEQIKIVLMQTEVISNPPQDARCILCDARINAYDNAGLGFFVLLGSGIVRPICPACAFPHAPLLVAANQARLDAMESGAFG